MREFFHSVKFKIILCIAALLLGLMTYVAVAAGTQTLPEQVISTVTYPFVTAANAISNGVNGFIDKWVNADTYKAQNDELRELVTQMYERSADYEALQKENEQLREMLQLSKEHKDFVFSEPCGIIARNANDMYGGFTINHTGKTPEETVKEFDGKGYGDFKVAVGEAVCAVLKPLQEEVARLEKDKAYIDGIIKANAEKAGYYANKTLRKVQKKVGFPEKIR